MKARRPRSLLLLAFAFAPACAAETVDLPPAAPAHWQSTISSSASPTAPTAKERALVDTYTKALASPRMAGLAPMVNDETLFTFGARSTRGRDKAIAQHEEMFGAFEGRRFVASRAWLMDSTQTINAQAFEWTMTGVQARPWMGVAPTAKPVTIRGLTLLWTTDDGVLSEVHVYFDEEVVKAQLGAGSLELRRLPAPVAPTTPTQVMERTGAAPEKANVMTFRAMLQALEDNDEPAFLATMTDDVSVFALDAGEPARGKDEARASFRTLRKSIRQLDTVVENAWGVGSFAIVEYAITGLQIAPLRRVTFAGGGGLHPLHSQYVDVAEFHDGKVARIWRYSDPAAFGAL